VFGQRHPDSYIHLQLVPFGTTIIGDCRLGVRAAPEDDINPTRAARHRGAPQGSGQPVCPTATLQDVFSLSPDRANIHSPPGSRIHNQASEKIGWRRANMVRTFLSEVFRYCGPRALIKSNDVTALIPRARPTRLARASRHGMPSECSIVMERALPHIKRV
jgi:hypothetical protein